MRIISALPITAAGVLLLAAGGAVAQMGGDAGENAQSESAMAPECAQLGGRMRDSCLEKAQRAARKTKADGASATMSKKGGKGLSKADADLINSTNAAAKVKLDANDFAGAAAEYQKGIDTAPSNPARHVLYAGLSIALRRQAVAAYNSAPRPTPPGFGAGNDEIRKFNAAAQAAQTERTAAALPLLKRANEAAAQAAAGSDASDNKVADPTIGAELREDAWLFYTMDSRGTLAAPRPSIDLEMTWFRRWLTGPPAPAPADIAKYGFAMAAAVTAKDPAAGLTLADEMQAQAGSGVDQALAYAEIVVAAKTPAGDPHRAKALAGLIAIEGSVIEGGRRSQLARLKTALAS